MAYDLSQKGEYTLSMGRWVGLILITLGAIGFWFLARDVTSSNPHDPKPKSSELGSTISEDVLARVNQHLKQTQFKQEIAQLRAQNIFLKELPPVGERVWQAPQEIYEKPLSGTDKTYQSYLDEWLKLQWESRPSNDRVDYEVWQKAFELQQKEKFDRWARKHYLWQFRKNAWQAGWYVEVNSDGQIISKRPLSREERNQPFPEPEPSLTLE